MSNQCETHTQEIMTMRAKVHDMASRLSVIGTKIDLISDEKIPERLATLEATVWGVNKNNGMKSELKSIVHNMTEFQQSFFSELDKRIERLNEESERRFEVNAERLDKLEAQVLVHSRYVWFIGVIIASIGYAPTFFEFIKGIVK